MQRSCAVCGASSGAKMYCSRSCENRAYHQRYTERNGEAHSTRYRREHGRPSQRPREIVCGGCGQRVTVVKPTAQYCNKTCWAAARAARRPKPGTALVHVGPLEPLTWEPQHISSGRKWVAGRCAWCDDPFVIVDQLTARFCSKRCQSAHGKAARGRFIISPRRRLALYERDGWTCQLCGDPVDPDLPPSDVWAATLDHIRCQAWGEPDHSDDNLRLAHRWCNSVRNDERHYTADVLRVS